MRRPGSRYVAEVEDSSVKGRVKKFQFSEDESHILEFGDGKLRFYFRQGQLTVAETDAAISNGTFDSDITDWDDVSPGTGSGSIAHSFGGATSFGTFGAAEDTDLGFGDVFTDGLNIGFQFTTGTIAGEVTEVRVEVTQVNDAFDAVCALYTDSGGSPDTQVGGNSDAETLNATGNVAFTWSSNAPSLSAATTYWVVLTDTTAAGDGVRLSICSDQGSGFASGRHDTIGSIADASGGLASDQDWRVGITIMPESGNGRLALIPGGTGTLDRAVAEQDVTTTDTGQEHVLKFRVIGDPGDRIDVLIGSASGEEDVLSATEFLTGYHCVAFTPTSSPFYVRFMNRGSIVNKTIYIDDVSILSNSAVEIDTPWAEDELFEIEGPGTGDVLYLFHPDVATHKLERRGLRSWSLIEVAWQDGPYLKEDTEGTTLTPSATSGVAVTVTAAATTGLPYKINGGLGFQSTDLGRIIRISNPSSGVEWGWGIIVEVVSTSEVKVHVKSAFSQSGVAATRWRLGAWSGTTGYPRTGAFFEQRLYAASTDDQPQTFWASQTADFENMSPDNIDDDNDGTVEDDDALDFTLSADEVNPILWLSPGEDTLAIGTAGGEWIPASEGAVITPLDITVRKQTSHGSASVQPIRIGQVVLFLQAAKREVREFAFSFETDGFVANDMTRLAEHITAGGIVEMDYQQEPDSLLWAVRGDGTLLSMTYRREEDVVAWGRHVLGGAFSGGQAVVESVAVIPGFDDDDQVQHSGDRNEVWIIVKRTINGQTKRYVEFFEGDFETGDDKDDAYYADSLITYDGAATSTITGLDHLEGQTVKVWGDGYIRTPKTVSSGQITLDANASTAQIGLGASHTLKTLKVEGGNPAGTAQGRRKRISGITFMLLNSLKLEYDSANSAPNADPSVLQFRTVAAAVDTDTALFTGEHHVSVQGRWANDVRVIVSSDQPAPFTLLAMVPKIAENPLK